MLLHVFMGGLTRTLGGFLFRPRVLDGALNPFARRAALCLAGSAALMAEPVLGRRPAVHPGFLDMGSVVHSARGVFLSVLGILGWIRPDGGVNLVGCKPVKPRPAASLRFCRTHGAYFA